MSPYLPNTSAEREEMLKAIGISSVEELFAGIPADIRLRKSLELPAAVPELELERELLDLSRKNADAGEYSSFLGAGSYRHFVPSAVDFLAGRAEFYTAYTPYQAEASQGILQAFFEYQSMISEIAGLEVTNASMYDGASALAEAALLAHNNGGRRKIVVSRAVHPEYRRVLATYLSGLSLEIAEVSFRKDGVTDPERLEAETDDRTAAVIIQSPNFFGSLEEMEAAAEISHQRGALFVAVFNPVAAAILRSPGECGADVAVSEGQALGGARNFGGYGLGTFSCRREFIRRMPGRIVSRTVDREGKRGFVLSLQTREQHIRREKATSNICSNEALCALRAAIHLALIGRDGLERVALLNLERAHYLAQAVGRIKGFTRKFSAPFFNETAFDCPLPPAKINAELLKAKIIGGYELDRDYPELENGMLFCATEMNGREEIDRLASALAEMKIRG